MKGYQIFAVLSAAVLSCCPLAFPATAVQDIVLNDTLADEELSDDGVMVYYDHTSGALPAYFEIPSVFDGKPVYGIADNGFSSIQELVHVTIPGTVILIGKHGFASCPNLEQVDFASGLIAIDDYGFECCYALKKVVLPDTVTNLGMGAFSVTGVQSVQFSPNLTMMGQGCFYECDSLTDVTLPASLIKVGDQIFRNCDNLKSATVAGPVCSELMFGDCPKLESVTFLDPDCEIWPYGSTVCNEMTTPGRGVYHGVIRGYVGSTAQEYAEHWNYRFEPLDPENYVTTSPAETAPPPDWWYGTTAADPSVTTTLPVTTAVTTTTTPVMTTTSPFGADHKLVLNGICYEQRSSYIMVSGYQANAALPAEIVIPESIAGQPVKVIGEKAFADLKGVTSVTLPLSVSSIENQAFYHCPDLQTLILRNPEISLNGDWSLICNDDLGMYTGVMKGYYPSDAAGFASMHEIRFEALPEVRGDVTLDGEVSIEDAQRTLKAYTARIAGNPDGLLTLQKKTGDVNGDMIISVEDAQLILKYYTQVSVAGNPITWDDLLNK